MKKYIPILVIVTLAFTAYFLGLHNYLSLEKFRENKELLEDFIDRNYILAILAYLVTYILVVALSIPGAIIMTLSGGFLFGRLVGTFLNVIAATIGAFIFFVSAKMASSDLIKEQSSSKLIGKMKTGFEENAFSYLLTLRFMPIFPFVAINIGAALFQVNAVIFFFGTLIGIIPGTFVYTSMGYALRSVIDTDDFSTNLILDPNILIALGGLAILALIPVIYKKFKK